jgi:hypothetical protein
MEWARILAYITGTVDQELLLPQGSASFAPHILIKHHLASYAEHSDGDG